MNFTKLFSSFNTNAHNNESTVSIPVNAAASSFCTCCGVDVTQFK